MLKEIIKDLKELEAGWDGENAPPIRRIVLEFILSLEDVIPKKFILTPTRGGGVHLLIELYPDPTYFLFVFEVDKSIIMITGDNTKRPYRKEIDATKLRHFLSLLQTRQQIDEDMSRGSGFDNPSN